MKIFPIACCLAFLISCGPKNSTQAGEDLIKYLHNENQKRMQAIQNRAMNIYQNRGLNLLYDEVERLDSIQNHYSKWILGESSAGEFEDSIKVEITKDLKEVYSILEKRYGSQEIHFSFKLYPEQEVKLKILTIIQAIISKMEEDFWQAFLSEIDSYATVLAIPQSVKGDTVQYYIHAGYEGGVFPASILMNESKTRLGNGFFQEIKVAKEELNNADGKINVLIPKFAGKGGLQVFEIKLDNTLRHVGVK